MRALTAFIVAFAFAGIAHAQEAPADTPERAAALARNHEAAAAIIARDNVAGRFVDASTADAMILVQPETRLICTGTPDTLRVSFAPPRPSIVSARCFTHVEGEALGTFDIELLGLALVPGAAAAMSESNVGVVMQAPVHYFAEDWAQEIQGQPWSGPHVEVGGGASPAHPPYEIRRYQGVREGQPRYLRVAWANFGRWTFIQRVEAPLDNQVAVETLASLHFYNSLLASFPQQPPPSTP